MLKAAKPCAKIYKRVLLMAEKTNVMPNNLDAEQALLGCMLIDNEILAEVLDGLKKEDFYQESPSISFPQ